MPAPEAAGDHLLRATRRALQAGQLRLAEKHLNQLLHDHPADAEASELLGIVYARLSRPEAAQKAFVAATRNAPGRPTAHYNYALFLHSQGEWDEALEENRAALLLCPTHTGALALEQVLVQEQKDRAYVAPEGFALVGAVRNPLTQPSDEWALLRCPTCGGKNFVTARTCIRCGSLLPETEPLRPVE